MLPQLRKETQVLIGYITYFISRKYLILKYLIARCCWYYKPVFLFSYRKGRLLTGTSFAGYTCQIFRLQIRRLAQRTECNAYRWWLGLASFAEQRK